MRRPRCGLPASSERSGTAVKGLTVASRDAMTQCCVIVPRNWPRKQLDQKYASKFEARREPSHEEYVMTQKTETDLSHRPFHPAPRLVVGGRDPAANHGFVNPPVHHVSTVLYPTAEDFLARRSRYLYGRRGTPTSEALENALRELEGPACAGVALLPSGLAAISTALLAVLNAGDHLLVTDSAYQPTRRFCDNVLQRYGIATTYYDPLIGGDIAALMQPNTRAVFVEAPGSLSFEIQDVPAIAAAAHAAGALVVMDNTWATSLYFPAFDKGVDLSIQAASKYIGGHSDVMLGTVSANQTAWERLRGTVHTLGLCVGPDVIYLC